MICCRRAGTARTAGSAACEASQAVDSRIGVQNDKGIKLRNGTVPRQPCLGNIATPARSARAPALRSCAAGYDAAAVLACEVAARCWSGSTWCMQSARVLDLGSGTGFVAQNLNTLRSGAGRHIDFSWKIVTRIPAAVVSEMLVVAPGARRSPPVCAEMGACLWPMPRRSGMQQSGAGVGARPHQVLQEVHRVLRGGGLFMFSTLGPDTLRELRSADPRGAAGTHRLADMHDVGDALVRQGFADPVMDMEHLTLTYPDVGALLQELRASGYAQAPQPVSAGLHGRGWLRTGAPLRCRADGRVPATFRSSTVMPGNRAARVCTSRRKRRDPIRAAHPRRCQRKAQAPGLILL